MDATSPSNEEGLNDFAGFEKYLNKKYGTNRDIDSKLYEKEKQNWDKNEGLKSFYTTNLSQDLLNLGEGGLDIAFASFVPQIKAGMGVV